MPILSFGNASNILGSATSDEIFIGGMDGVDMLLPISLDGIVLFAIKLSTINDPELFSNPAIFLLCASLCTSSISLYFLRYAPTTKMAITSTTTTTENMVTPSGCMAKTTSYFLFC